MRILPFTLALTVLSLTFCAQKKEAPAVVTDTTNITTTNPPVTPTDTAKKLVWSDEFSTPGRPDTTKWAYDIGNGNNGWGNNELQYYTSDTTNARVENGNLVIEARKERKGNSAYTSARMLTQGKKSWTYGRFEIRAKLPKGTGSWPAIWMLGENIPTVGWPTCGEIDIMEHVGFDPGMINFTVHSKWYNWGLNTPKTSKTLIKDFGDAFHIYSIDWDKSKIQFYVDGVMYYSFYNEGKGATYYPFTDPEFLLLNLAVGGNWGGTKGVDDSIFPIRMEVDYVRIYQ
jgi:beta-glucanase (GH16 family)